MQTRIRLMMPSAASLVAILCWVPIICAKVTQSWPNGPLRSSSRWILDAENSTVTYAGVNWPGAADTMLPEGLQYASIEDTVSKIKSLGMNVIRLTYAIEMIDDIYSGEDVPIHTSLINALGEDNGTAVYTQILKNNPQFGANTTRLQVFEAVAKGCYDQQIYVHLDNHISKAEWCCDTADGNSWFGDTYFNVSNWKRGLAYMATTVKDWPAVVSMGMRNELRSPDDNATLVTTSYNWDTWYPNMISAAEAIYTANPDVLIFFSGLGFDTDLSPIPTGADLGSGQSFDKEAYVFKDRIVLELHNYQTTATECSTIEQTLINGGYDALDSTNSSIKNVLPVVMTEFGYANDNSTYTGVYATCLKQFLPEHKAGWTVWALAGSYYIRQGEQDEDESWGLLDHTWSSWRSPANIENMIKPMVNATLAA